MQDKYKWLEPRVKVLIEIASPFKTIIPEVFYQVGEWSIVKLLAILRFVEIYTKIIKAPRQRAFFDKMYYIDLLAGSGLCRIGAKGDIVAGSALIACQHCFHPFDTYFLVEKDARTAKALELRFKTLAANFQLYNCDCNDCIDDIMSEMEKRSHYLALVDCEGLDVSWSTMESLFAQNGDVLFNFQTQGISRTVGKAMKRSPGWKSASERLTWFFGDDGWKEHENPDELLQHYMNKIEEQTSRKVVLPLPVKGAGGYRYDLILATRKTSGGNPWIRPMQELRSIMGGYRPDVVKMTLDMLMKRQLSLNDTYVV
jgi:three-Cys-motif partner protein